MALQVTIYPIRQFGGFLWRYQLHGNPWQQQTASGMLNTELVPEAKLGEWDRRTLIRLLPSQLQGHRYTIRVIRKLTKGHRVQF